jgi:hypothetical protein
VKTRRETTGLTEPTTPDVVPALSTLERIENRLALATDSGDWVRFQACFTADARADYGALGAGPIAEIVSAIRGSQARYAGTMNLVGTHLAEVDGNRGRAETYVVSHHFRNQDGESWDDHAGTHYLDEFVYGPQGWQIARRVARLRWFRSDRIVGGWQ